MEKTKVFYVPESLKDVNLATAIIFDKVTKIEGLSDIEKSLQIIASINGMEVDELREIPFTELDKVGAPIVNLFINNEEVLDVKEHLRISIDKLEYAIIPDFRKMELGSYIDLLELLKAPLPNIHKIMAILYRPIKNDYSNWYELEPYSTENSKSVEERADIFLKKMPYSIARSTVNFMKESIQKLPISITLRSSQSQRSEKQKLPIDQKS